MTRLLETAYDKVATQPERRQDEFAAIILEAREDDERWSQKFASSLDVLARLAKEALAQYEAGETLPLEPDAL